MRWGRRRRYNRWFDKGVEDEERRIDDELRRRRGDRPGDDTEPVDLEPEESAAYQAGRSHARSRRGFNG